MATYKAGTGSGSITIDGSKVSYKNGDIINIAAGKYTSLTVQNIQLADGQFITIQNSGGVVEIIGNMVQAYNLINFSRLKGVVVSGAGTEGIDKGIFIHENRYRGIMITGYVSDLTFQQIWFDNINDYVINFNDFSDFLYDGATPSSYAKNMKFVNLEFSNCSTCINFRGSGTSNGITTGMVKGLEVVGCYIHDSPYIGTAVYAGAVEDFNIHHNVINNINQKNDNHNGIFHISGNGSIHHNKCTNHQGNLIRNWTFTVGTAPKTTYIYNNIVVGSRKYSAFEAQSFKSYIASGKTCYANVLCFNNTCGNLNSTHDWGAGVIDLYDLFGGTCDVFNNLSFNMYPTVGSVIVNQQNITVAKTRDNMYFSTIDAAGIDSVTYIPKAGSSVINKGSAAPFTVDDYYGNSRANGNDVGAVNSDSIVTPPVTPPVIKKVLAVFYSEEYQLVIYSDGTTEKKAV